MYTYKHKSNETGVVLLISHKMDFRKGNYYDGRANFKHSKTYVTVALKDIRTKI